MRPRHTGIATHRFAHCVVCAVGITSIAFGSVATAGTPDCAWDSTFGVPGANATVSTLAVYNDGSGLALYIGGSFTSVGGVPANCIAKWDGKSWSPLGEGLQGGAVPSALSMAVFDDGSGSGPALFVGGNFTTAGKTSTQGIAKWNGKTWSAVGGGGTGGPIGHAVHALAVFDDESGTGPALYASGEFTNVGGVTAFFVAKYNGTSWAGLNGGMDSTVYALQPFNDGSGPALYAGGVFSKAGGVNAARIAKWKVGDDGIGSWSALDSGIQGLAVRALAVFDDGAGDGPALFAAGSFNSASGVGVNHIAKFAGGNWVDVGGGVSGVPAPDISALAVFDDGTGSSLFAGGSFATAGQSTSHNLAKWNGSAWSEARGGCNGSVFSLLNVAGALRVTNDKPKTTARKKHVSTSQSSSNALFHPNGSLVVGGNFSQVGMVSAESIAVLNHCAQPQPGDVNDDGVVDVSDLLAVINAWGPCPSAPQPCPADIAPQPTGDGEVNVSDLLMVINNWGT